MKRIILSVEDADMRLAMTGVLSARGYAVSAAPGPEAAVAAAREKASLVVADASMDMSPGEFLGELKRAAPGLPVLFLTGYGHLASPGALADLGADACLRKPFDNRVLLHAVEKLAGGPLEEAAADPAGPAAEPLPRVHEGEELWPSRSESDRLTYKAAAVLTASAALLAGAGWLASQLLSR